jgi:hypothetical protein
VGLNLLPRRLWENGDGERLTVECVGVVVVHVEWSRRGTTWVPNCFWLGSLGEETPISLVVEFFEGVTVGVGVERGCIGTSRCGTKGTEFRVFGRG